MPANRSPEDFMREAISLSLEGMRQNSGGPFGAVVVKEGRAIGSGFNRVLEKNDPTAHAEMEAIREASSFLNTFDLTGCEIYASCKPCPMCLSAILWSRISRIYFANETADAAEIGFDDGRFYSAISGDSGAGSPEMVQILRDEAMDAFVEWRLKGDRKNY